MLLPGPASYDAAKGFDATRAAAPSVDFGHAPNPRALVPKPADALEPSCATYDGAGVWMSYLVGGAFGANVRPPSVVFGREPRLPPARLAAGVVEGEMLLLLQLPSAKPAPGGALPFDRQTGRADLPQEKPASEMLSGADYEVNERPVRRRWPVVDFGSAPPRRSLFEARDGGGDALDLEPRADVVLPRAPAVDFSRAPGREAESEGGAPPEGQLLDLQPLMLPSGASAELPSQPCNVAMRRDPNHPRRRRQRWPIVRSEEDVLLDEIESAIASVTAAEQSERIDHAH
jgi:hypothetical protein